MALLESKALPLGTTMPDFALKDPDGNLYQSDQLYRERGLLIAFLCNHCPYALAVWPRYIRLARYARTKGIYAIAINPNINPHYPEDSAPNMKIKIKEWGVDFPYLVDETQQVAKSFKAQCTPDIYLFDQKHELLYHGRIDDNWQDEAKVTKEELKAAIDSYATGRPVDVKQRPTMGCSIKWNA